MAGYDERFCRMWEFYLAGCEVAFRYMNQMVFQIQLARTPGRRAADARLHGRRRERGVNAHALDGGGVTEVVHSAFHWLSVDRTPPHSRW